MPRKGYIAKREVAPDPVYNSTLVTKLVTHDAGGNKVDRAGNLLHGHDQS